MEPTAESTDVLVVGAGPAGSAAAAWLARSGREVVLADAADVPRDKPCGDGLTPRAIAELRALGLGDWLRGRAVNWGLRAAGFGQELLPAVAGRQPAPVRRRGPPAGAGRRHPRRSPSTPARSRCEGRRAVDVVRDGGARDRRRPQPAGAGTLRLPDPRRRRRRPLAARPGCSAGLAPRHRVRRRGPRLREVGAGRRPWISSHLELRGAAGRAALRLRLDLPARRRRGEPRASARWRPRAAPPTSTCARCWPTTPTCAARSGSSTASREPCGRRCCRWAAPSPASPARTGR